MQNTRVESIETLPGSRADLCLSDLAKSGAPVSFRIEERNGRFHLESADRLRVEAVRPHVYRLVRA